MVINLKQPPISFVSICHATEGKYSGMGGTGAKSSSVDVIRCCSACRFLCDICKSAVHNLRKIAPAPIACLCLYGIVKQRSVKQHQRMNAFFSRHVPTLVNNFYDNKKLQFFISDFSATRHPASCKLTQCLWHFFAILGLFVTFQSNHKGTKWFLCKIVVGKVK